MSKAKIIPIKKKVAASVALQYVLEAKMRHMSLSSYIEWLKHKAKVTTPYDKMVADYEAQQQGQSPAKPQPEPEAKGSGLGKGEGAEVQ